MTPGPLTAMVVYLATLGHWYIAIGLLLTLAILDLIEAALRQSDPFALLEGGG